MSTCKCHEIIYDPRSERESFLCDVCNPTTPFTNETTRLLNSEMSFTLYLYKCTADNQKISDMDPRYQDYEVSFKTERGVVSIFSKSIEHYDKAYKYICSIYGEESDDVGDALIWES